MTCWNIRIKLLMHLKMVFFLSGHLKTSDDAATWSCVRSCKGFSSEN